MFRDNLPSYIRSRKHEVHCIEEDRLALTSFTTKRFMINKFESLPFGHKMIPYYRAQQLAQIEAEEALTR